MQNVERIIGETMSVDYVICTPIEDLTIEELTELASKAKGKFTVEIRKETSNFYQGVLVKTKRI